MRGCTLALSLALCLIVADGAIAQKQPVAPAEASQQAKPQSPPLSDGERQAMAARAKTLWTEITELMKEQKRDEAAVRLEEMLPLLRRMLGDDHSQVVDALVCQAALEETRGNWAAARKARSEILDIKTRVLGKDNWQVVDARLQLADCELLDGLSDKKRNDWAAAGQLLAEAKSLREKAKLSDSLMAAAQSANLYAGMGGKEHWLAMKGMAYMGYVLTLMRQYDKALELLRRAAETNEKVLGAEHPTTADNLNKISDVYFLKGDYKTSIALDKRALAIYEKTLGPESVEAAQDLHNLATMYSSLGDVQTALSYCERALAIREKALGPEHRHTAITLDTLAGIRSTQGDFAAAKELYDRSLAIFQKTLGPENYQIAQSLVNVAHMHEIFGEYESAMQLYQRSLAIREKVLGPEHPQTADGLSTMARFYTSQGDYASALPMFQRALAINEKALGAESHHTANSMASLADLYCAQGDFASALPLCQRALAIYEKTAGAEHRQTADCLERLARIRDAQGNRAAAIDLYKRALAIYERLFGPDNTTTANTLTNLGGVYQALGEYAAALPLYERALKAEEKILGAEHHNTATCISNVSLLYEAQGDYKSALPLARRALAIGRKHLDSVAVVQAERQQLTSQNLSRYFLDGFLSAAAMSAVDAADVYNPVLAWKGATFARQRSLRAIGHAQRDDPAASQLYAELESKSRALANGFTAMPPQSRLEAHREGLARLSSEVEELQQRLAKASLEFAGARRAARATSADIERALPKDVALVDLVEYDHFGRVSAKDKTPRVHRRLMGFVVRSGRGIKRLDLGPADRLYPTVITWRAASLLPIATVPQEVESANPVVADWRKTHGTNAIPEAKLREWVWDKIAPHVDGCTTILVSPDGALSWFSWAALPGKQPGRYLIEDVAIAVVPVAQVLPELLAARPDGEQKSPSLLVVGDVDFKADPGQGKRSAGLRRNAEATTELLPIRPLPGTFTEVTRIANLFRQAMPQGQVKKMHGKEPTEQAVRDAAPQSTYVHLATHGYYDGRSAAANTRLDGHAPLRPADDGLVGADASRMHPDLLCGITLVGAARPAEADKDDGPGSQGPGSGARRHGDAFRLPDRAGGSSGNGGHAFAAARIPGGGST